MEQPVIEASQEELAEERIENEEQNGIFMRFLNALLDGGKNGVELGLQIIPGVLIITTAVIMITFGTGDAGVYNGTANQGVPILPWLADKVHWIFEWLFGFKHMELIAFPMTALGAVGAALGLLPTFNAAGILDGNAIAAQQLAGFALGSVVAGVCSMLDPDCVILSGSVINCGHYWHDAVAQGFAETAMEPLRGTPILLASLGDNAPLIGAAEHFVRSAYADI